MPVAKSKYLVGIIIAIIVLIAAAAATFFYLQSKANTSTELTGTVRHISCINMGFPCAEDYVELNDGERCGIGSSYKQYLNKKVAIEGKKTIDDFDGGPKVCTIEVTSMRAI